MKTPFNFCCLPDVHMLPRNSTAIYTGLPKVPSYLPAFVMYISKETFVLVENVLIKESNVRKEKTELQESVRIFIFVAYYILRSFKFYL